MITIRNLKKSYGEKVIYDGFDMDVEEGKVTCIFGESGSGKTTLLNAVAALTEYGGEISKVKCSCVFQTSRLIPALTVLKNLTLIGADRQNALAALESVGLKGLENAYPKTLSGGEAQRVALCRALLFGGDLLLLDEPFSSLDLKNKINCINVFASEIKKSGKTCLFVTHDIDEALFFADRIVVIKGGAIAAEYQNPQRSSYGAENALRAKIIETLMVDEQFEKQAL